MNIGRALENAIETQDICVSTVREAVKCALPKVKKMFVVKCFHRASMDHIEVNF